jgi:hypothetical protein
MDVSLSTVTPSVTEKIAPLNSEINPEKYEHPCQVGDLNPSGQKGTQPAELCPIRTTQSFSPDLIIGYPTLPFNLTRQLVHRSSSGHVIFDPWPNLSRKSHLIRFNKFSLFFSYLQSFGIRDSDFHHRHSLPSALTARISLKKKHGSIKLYDSDCFANAAKETLLANYFLFSFLSLHLLSCTFMNSFFLLWLKRLFLCVWIETVIVIRRHGSERNWTPTCIQPIFSRAGPCSLFRILLSARWARLSFVCTCSGSRPIMYMPIYPWFTWQRHF